MEERFEVWWLPAERKSRDIHDKVGVVSEYWLVFFEVHFHESYK